jgi:diketogulonate reductase-like aldo/keto reductase
VRDFARANGIAYMAYSSFGTQWSGKYPKNNNPVFSNPVLKNIAKKHKTTVSAVVLSWVLQEDAIAIPRASKEEHIHENAAFIVHQEDEDGEEKNKENVVDTDTDKAENNLKNKKRMLRVFLDAEDMKAIRDLDGTLGTPWD